MKPVLPAANTWELQYKSQNGEWKRSQGPYYRTRTQARIDLKLYYRNKCIRYRICKVIKEP